MLIEAVSSVEFLSTIVTLVLLAVFMTHPRKSLLLIF